VQARGQSRYQVRFGWGASGAARIARDAHVIVWVDVLPTTPRGADRRAAVGALPGGPEVLLGHLGNAAAVAGRVTSLQAERGDRCVVAVVAAGIDDDPVRDAAADAGEAGDAAVAPDFAVEDLLAAGAVIDALAAVGIDHTSPEAAAACASFTGLRRAVRHLVTASVSAGMLDAGGHGALVQEALAASADLVTLRPARPGTRRD
jgi:phosphosulfolactate phosphohydrolase-like enzyme